MARKKSARKPSALQRDKFIIQGAIKLKKAGILSKRTKLHAGRFVSRGVLKKVQDNLDALSLNYRAIPVSKKVASRAKAEGFVVVQGNRILSPPDKKIIAAIKRGEPAGVKRVKGGFLTSKILPYDTFDLKMLYNRLKLGKLEKTLGPGEQFGFRFHQHFSYQTFKNTDALAKYLTHYRSIFDAAGKLRLDMLGETFRNLEVIKVEPDKIDKYNIDGAIRKDIQKKKQKTYQDRREQGISYYYKRLNKMHPDRAMREVKRNNEKSKQKRAALQADPKALEVYRDKARARARKSYHGRKKK